MKKKTRGFSFLLMILIVFAICGCAQKKEANVSSIDQIRIHDEEKDELKCGDENWLIEKNQFYETLKKNLYDNVEITEEFVDRSEIDGVSLPDDTKEYIYSYSNTDGQAIGEIAEHEITGVNLCCISIEGKSEIQYIYLLIYFFKDTDNRTNTDLLNKLEMKYGKSTDSFYSSETGFGHSEWVDTNNNSIYISYTLGDIMIRYKCGDVDEYLDNLRSGKYSNEHSKGL